MNGDYTFVLKETSTAVTHQLSLICLTDSDAMLIARGIGGGRDVEVWDHDRLVGQLQAHALREGGIAA